MRALLATLRFLSKSEMRTLKPLVTIGVPCKNYGAYLPDCLRSITEEQTYPNLEVLGVDYGSFDDTLSIFRVHGVKTIQEHSLMSALNSIIDSASGEYVCMMDADDKLDPRYIEAAVDALEQKSAAVAYTDCQMFGARSETVAFEDYSWATCIDHSYIMTPSVFRKSVADKWGVRMDPAFESSCYDFDFWMNLLQHGDLAVHIPEALYFRRIHSANHSATSASNCTRLLRQKYPFFTGRGST